MTRVLNAVARPECLDELHRFLDGVWREAPDVPDAARRRITTALAELVANVVIHGRTESGRDPSLQLTVEVTPDRLAAVLHDDGTAVSQPSPAEPIDDLAESGRGLALAAASVDQLTYERADDSNVWQLSVVLN